MALLDIDVIGVQTAIEAIQREALHASRAHIMGMVAAGEVLVLAAKVEAPVSTDPGGSGRYPAGTLRERIHFVGPSIGPGGAYGHVYADRPFYAKFVARGTGAHLIQADAYGALDTPYGPKTSVVHPGITTKNPFLERAFLQSEPLMMAAWKRAF